MVGRGEGVCSGARDAPDSGSVRIRPAIIPIQLPIFTLFPAKVFPAQGDEQKLGAADGDDVIAVDLHRADDSLAVDLDEVAPGAGAYIVDAFTAVIGHHGVVLAGDLVVAPDVDVAHLPADVVVAGVDPVVHPAALALDAHQPAHHRLRLALHGIRADVRRLERIDGTGAVVAHGDRLAIGGAGTVRLVGTAYRLRGTHLA